MPITPIPPLVGAYGSGTYGSGTYGSLGTADAVAGRTLDSVRELVGRLTQRGFVVGDGTTGAGGTVSPATMTDGTLLADATRGGEYYVRARLLRTGLPATGVAGTDRVRTISGYDPSTGTLSLTPDYSAGGAPATGEPYEVWTVWDPREVEDAIRRVQRHMYALADISIAGVASRKQYALTTAAPWLKNPAQVAQIELQTGTVTDQYDWPTLPTNRVRQAYTSGGPALVLDLRGDALGTADTVVVRAWTDFDSLTPLVLPTDSTVAPIDWLAWEAIYEMANAPGRNLDDDLRKRAAREVGRHRTANTPNVPMPLYDEPASWGFAGRGYS